MGPMWRATITTATQATAAANNKKEDGKVS
jgi:hypothetical protein